VLEASVDERSTGMSKDNLIRGGEPAFPQSFAIGKLPPGLTKREWIAAMCLQGLLANKGIHKSTIWSATQSAVLYADQLLESLEGIPKEESKLTKPEPYPIATPQTTRVS
jgi:hypothetical protein